MRTRIAQHLDWLLTPQAAAPTGRAALFVAQKVERGQLPAGFAGHDFAVFLLTVAAEIEHILMVQYLYAAYSLGGDQVPSKHREQVRRWQETILGIAKEEMGHLITVQNVLRLLGGPLNLERNDYPWDVPFYPFKFTLEKLSRASLARYIFAESPDDWPSDVSKKEKADIIRLAMTDQSRPLEAVGRLYRKMIEVIDDRDLVAEELFQADTLPFQASWDEWGRAYRDGARGATMTPGSRTPDLIIATAYSRASAVDALKAVAQQGEAATIDPRTASKSHFRRFLEIFREFPDDEAGWSPVMQLAPNPRVVGGDESIQDTTYVANPHAHGWAQLINLRYRMLLAYLSHAFNLSGAHPTTFDAKARGLVVHHVFGEMYNLRTVAKILVRLPVDKPANPERAGPPFEMSYTVKLPTAERDCWRLHLDLLEASDDLRSEIAPHADEAGKKYLASFAAIDQETRVAIERLLRMGAASAPAIVPHLERSAI
jgi:hypothetical protein